MVGTEPLITDYAPTDEIQTAIVRAGAKIDILPPNDLDDVTATRQLMGLDEVTALRRH